MSKPVFMNFSFLLLIAGWLLLPSSLGAQTVETLKILPTPICAMKSIRLPTYPMKWNNRIIQYGPQARSLPVTVFSSPFRRKTALFILRNPADWIAFYRPVPAPQPPVDFKSKMIIVLVFQDCHDQVSFLSYCNYPDKINVSIEDYQSPIQCDHRIYPGAIAAIAVPNSTSRLSWSITLRQ